MANNIQSNPVYYSLATLTSGQNSPSRTVVLHKRPDQDGFGVYIGEDIPSGLYIVTVERHSPAEDANIQPGDRVLAINGQLVSSMSTNPKEMLIKAATNTQSLTLTIQSTDIYQKLDLPPTNNYKDNNAHSNKGYSSRQTLDTSMDLEGYLRSLFSNQNVQLVPSANNNEFILKSDPYAPPTANLRSLPNHDYRSSGDKKQHDRRRHHHHHRDSKRTVLVTKETQTSIDNDQNENMSQEQSQASPTRQYPSMGTSHRILRTQQQTSSDNSTQELQESRPSLTNKTSDFTALPPSPNLDDTSTYAATYRTPLPAPTFAAAPSATSDNVIGKSIKTTHLPSQHMADVVEAALTASRKREQSNNLEQVPLRESASVTTRTTTSSSSRQPPENLSRESAPVTKRTSTSPSTRQPPENTSREPASGTTRTTTSSSSRQPSGNTSREPAPVTTRTTTSSSSRQPSGNASREPASGTAETTQSRPPPPPYTATAEKNSAITPVNNRDSANEGSYNVRDAEENQQPKLKPPARSEGIHDVRLLRLPDFQGFGFHLQYNKSYYLVQRVEAGSPAEKAGLQANDVIHSINQQTTTNMPHALFVQIVNASSEVDFVVQTVEEYLRDNPQPVRNAQAAAAVASVINVENDKRKSGITKALGKLTSR